LALRHKSYGKKPPKRAKDEDSDDEAPPLERGEGWRDVSVRLPTLRVDAVAKAAFKISRSQAEKDFYANKFQVNGKRMSKKSDWLNEGDELQYVRERAEDGGEKGVSRAELLRVSNEEDKVLVVMRVWKKV